MNCFKLSGNFDSLSDEPTSLNMITHMYTFVRCRMHGYVRDWNVSHSNRKESLRRRPNAAQHHELRKRTRYATSEAQPKNALVTPPQKKNSETNANILESALNATILHTILQCNFDEFFIHFHTFVHFVQMEILSTVILSNSTLSNWHCISAVLPYRTYSRLPKSTNWSKRQSDSEQYHSTMWNST
jgi:CHAD domain-containing protein